ncbi:MAG: hypothetical protein N2560_10015 [Ignavibacteria bacterium]|nr:hypothetical protein [Ignavibacteria bacterium]
MERFLLVLCSLVLQINLSVASDSLYTKYRNFIANPKAVENLRTTQIIGVIVDDKNDSLEFVLHRIFPDTLRLQVRFGETYAITVITSQNGWIVDPMRKIYEPKELLPDEILRIRSNILNLFSFLDPNIFEKVSSWDTQSPDTNYISFGLVNSTNDTIYYYFNKFSYSDIYKVVRFYHSPYTFKIVPKNLFSYSGFKIPRQIEVFANGAKRTLMYIVNININGEIDRNLFILKK